MSNFERIEQGMNLNLLVLEEHEKDKKKQAELITIDEFNSEENKYLQMSEKKRVFDDILVGYGDNMAGEDFIDLDIRASEKKDFFEENDKKKMTPKKRSRSQLADENVKLTEIFKIESPLKEGKKKCTKKFKKKESKVKKKYEKKEKKEKAVKKVSKIKTKPEKKEKIDKKKNITSATSNKNEGLIEYQVETSFIDLEIVNSTDKIANTDMILAIIEICVNSFKYGINLKNKTREFWKQVYLKSEWEHILNKFQPETLRKYWRLIQNLVSNNNFSPIIDTMNSYMKYFNSPTVKLLPVINAISAYILSRDTSFEPYVRILNNQQKFTDSDDLLNKKRIREGADKDITTSAKKTKIRPEDICNIIPQISITDQEIEEYEAKVIEEIVLSFIDSFEGKSEDEVLEILKITSFNIENAYLYLTDPEYFKELGYVGPDDKIIQRLEKSNAFKKLMLLKGKDSIEERKLFLNSN